MNTIKRTVRKEEYTARIPGLFAYIEDNALGQSVLHSAYDSKVGCYGKVVENMAVPCDASAPDNPDLVYLTAGTHSYRTIMDTYQTYYPDLNDDFINFVLNGIGKVEVPSTLKTKGTDLIPDFVYLANLKALYN
ncbi:MAG: hypothetical protein LUD72_10205, partial [Bacteroidales bacterium]|nr:hypothetical protein [Bacteroidales bacterium]